MIIIIKSNSAKKKKIVTMMKSILVIVAATLLGASAFQPVSFRQGQRQSLIVLHEKTAKKNVDGNLSVDWKRAQYCAEHFGACDVAEVEDLYAGVHKERIQHQLFGGVDLVHDSPADIEHRVIEEELELQLNLLEEEHKLASKEVELFPDEMTTNLPHLHEHAEAEHKEPIASRFIHQAEHQLVMQETAVGEDTLETLAMCAVVMALVLLPQFMS